MTENPQSQAEWPHDPVKFSRNMAEVAEKSQILVKEFLSRQQVDMGNIPFDPLNMGKAFLQISTQLLTDPAKLFERQASLWEGYLQLWQNTAERFLGDDAAPVIPADGRDKRFKDPAWQENMVFDFIRQSYLLTSSWLENTVKSVDGLDDKERRKLDFYTRQFIDAMSPSNFLLTNPQALKATLESNGENLAKGLANMLEDLERGKGSLRVSITDPDAFEIGRNLATTPGKVIFQNDLMQLIQYQPTTKEVHQTPLMIIPAWINKYYVMDLQAENSLIRWLVEEGHTVFVISWVNPDEVLARKSFDDYLTEGPLAALNAIEQATGEKAVNTLGYCIGGTLMSVFLAWLAARGEESRIKSATYFTTMTDFADSGEISVFIDEEQLAAMEAKMEERGYLEGSEMALTFNSLRANDMIWSFVVNNYLLGKDPFPFDLLFWNADSTRMPSAMHSFYLRNMYLENKLIQPGGVMVAGEPINLTRIKTPTMMISAKDDHIAPWKSTYTATQIFNGPIEFVLAGSGHIAGIINPPAKGKYSYWTAAPSPLQREGRDEGKTSSKLPKSPDDWFASTTEHKGSWWPHWGNWLKGFSTSQVPARVPGSGKLKVLEDAPGSYVKAV